MSNENEYDFDNLDPDDFRTPVQTSAIPAPRDPSQTFDEFVAAHVAATRRIYAAAGGVLETIIHLASGDTDWALAPIPPETLNEFLLRAHDEALKIGSRTMFVARPGQIGSAVVDTDHIGDPTSDEIVQRVRESGTFGLGVFYYAEQAGLVRQWRHGVMFSDRYAKLGDPIEGTADMRANLFAKVLR